MKTKIQNWLNILTQSFLLATFLLMPPAARSGAASVHPPTSILFATATRAANSPQRLAGFKTGSNLGASLAVTAIKVTGIAFTPLLAQADPTAPIEKFTHFLGEVFLIIGCITIAYGGYEVARGRVVEGLMCILGGLLLALAIPIMKWLQLLASGGG